MHADMRTAVCGLAIAATAAVATADRMLIEGILVRVNDRIVTTTDFRDRLVVEIGQAPDPPTTSEALRQMAEQIFDQVIDETILLERASERKLTVTDEMIDRQIANIREEQDLKDDRAFEAALEQAGLHEADLREQLRKTMTVQRVAQAEVKQIEITEEEVRRRYDREKEQFAVPAKLELQQLFFPIAEDGSDRAVVLQRVRGLVERVREGSDLQAEATLAGVEVLDLGAIPVGDLRDDRLAVLEPLEEGGLTDPLESAGGVLVLHLVRRIPAGYAPFDEVSDQVRKEIATEAYRDQTTGLVQRLKDEYLVEVHRDLFDQILSSLAAS